LNSTTSSGKEIFSQLTILPSTEPVSKEKCSFLPFYPKIRKAEFKKNSQNQIDETKSLIASQTNLTFSNIFRKKPKPLI
jgi:hypothetical protein